MCSTVVHMDLKPFLGQVRNLHQIPPEHCCTNKGILQERVAKRSNKITVGGYSSKLRPGPCNVKGTVDDSGTHALRLQKQDVRSLLGLWGVISYALILVCRQYASEQFIPVTHGLS